MLFQGLGSCRVLAFLLMLLLDPATLLSQFIGLLDEGFALFGFFRGLAFETYALLFLSLELRLFGAFGLTFSQGVLFGNAPPFDLRGLCNQRFFFDFFLLGLLTKLFFLGQEFSGLRVQSFAGAFIHGSLTRLGIGFLDGGEDFLVRGSGQRSATEDKSE